MCWHFPKTHLLTYVTHVTYPDAPPEGKASIERDCCKAPRKDCGHDGAEAYVDQANQDLDGLSGEPQAEALLLRLDPAFPLRLLFTVIHLLFSWSNK